MKVSAIFVSNGEVIKNDDNITPSYDDTIIEEVLQDIEDQVGADGFEKLVSVTIEDEEQPPFKTYIKGEDW